MFTNGRLSFGMFSKNNFTSNGKSIPELKEEFRPLVKDQLLTQQMQQKVVKNVTASPLDVKLFFENIPKDSLPLVNIEVEYAQIVREIPVSAAQKAEARKQLEGLRDRIIKGEDLNIDELVKKLV